MGIGIHFADQGHSVVPKQHIYPRKIQLQCPAGSKGSFLLGRGNGVRCHGTAVGNVGAEIVIVVAQHTGNHLAPNHVHPHVPAHAGFDELLHNEVFIAHAADDLFRRFPAVRQIDLLAEGAVGFLDHHGVSQRLFRFIQKVQLAIAHGLECFGGEHGGRSGHVICCQVQRREGLVIACFHSEGAVEKPQALLFQLPGQVNILVPEDRKIRQMGKALIHRAFQLCGGFHFQMDMFFFGGGTEHAVDFLKFLCIQKGVYDQPALHALFPPAMLDGKSIP